MWYEYVWWVHLSIWFSAFNIEYICWPMKHNPYNYVYFINFDVGTLADIIL